MKLTATGNWIISYNLEYILIIPDKKTIEPRLKLEEQRILKNVNQLKAFSSKIDNLANLPFNEFISELVQRDLNYIDFEFPPEKVRSGLFNI